MSLRTATAWVLLTAAAAACAVLSAVAGLFAGGAARPAFIACAGLFAVCTVLIGLTRRRYLQVLDAASVIDCLRLKRPGIRPTEHDAGVVPKGKMPKI